MAEFLSAEWIGELDRAGVTVEGLDGFSLEQVVTGGPGGDVRYRIAVEGGRVRACALPARAGPDGPGGADVTLTTSYATAVALATGRRDASEAFSAGEVRFRGDLSLLQAAAAALGAIADALAPIRTRTTFARG